MSTYERDPNTGNLNLIDGMRSIDSVKALMLDLCYPIGSIYISTKNVSPQTFLGGTWKSKSDYVLRGATSGVNFDSDTNDGGADSVSLAVGNLAAHSHTQDSHNHSQNAHAHNLPSNSWIMNTATSGSRIIGNAAGHYALTGNNFATQNKTATNNAQTATNQNNGSGTAFSVLNKYKNVYIWERTA